MPSRPDLVFLIHGTFAYRDEDCEPSESTPAWWQKNSRYVEEMNRLFAARAECWPDDVCDTMPWAKGSFWRFIDLWTVVGRKPFGWMRPKRRLRNRRLFAWSGLNSDSERRKAGRRLLEGLRALENDNEPGETPRSYHLIGHSHGGTVIWNALRLAAASGEELPHLRSWTTLGTPFPTYEPIRYRGLIGLIGLAATAAVGWWALHDMVAQMPHPLNFGRGWLTLRTLLDPGSPMKLFPPNISPVTFAVLLLLMILAGWFALAVITEPMRRLECWLERRNSASAWRQYGGRWLGLFSPIDEAIAGAQDTVGLYASDLVRLRWPGLPPVPRSYNPLEFLVVFPLRVVFWLAGWIFVPVMNLVALPLAEWIISLVFLLKFQGSDRLGTRLTRVSPEPFSRTDSADAAARGPLPGPLAETLHSRVRNRVESQVFEARSAFAADARSPRSPKELLRAYFSRMKLTNELVHNSYYEVDALRRATAYHILRTAPDAELISSLGDVRDWLDGAPLSPPDPESYLPRNKPPTSTPAWTYVLLGGAFLLLCTIGFGGLRHDLHETYVDRLVERMTLNDENPTSRGVDEQTLIREAFDLVRPEAEQRLVMAIVERGSASRRRGIHFLRQVATERTSDDALQTPDSGSSPPDALYPGTIAQFVELILDRHGDRHVQIDATRTLLGMSARARGSKRVIDQINWKLGVEGARPIHLGADDPNLVTGEALDPLVAQSAVTLAVQVSADPRSELRQILSSRSPTARILAAKLLGAIRDPSAAQPLIASLRHHDANVRSAVVKALGEIGNPSALKEVADRALSEQEDLSVRSDATLSLAGFGASALGPLRKILADGPYDLRFQAAEALGLIGKDASPVVPELLGARQRMFGGPRGGTVVLALGRIGDRSVVQQLIRELNNLKTTYEPSGVMSILGTMREPLAVPPLIAILQDSQRSVLHAQAVKTLGMIRSPSAVAPLIQALRDRHKNSQDIADALVAIGAPSVGPLVEALSDQHPEVRLYAVKTLGRIGREASPAVGRLVGLLERDPDIHVRWEAAEALGDIRDPSAVGPLISCLTNQHKTSPEDMLPVFAVIALGAIGDPSAIDTLIERIGNQNAWDRAVLENIGEFGKSAAKAVPRLAECLGDPHQEFYYRTDAARALGAIGVESAVGPLERALRDEDVHVRSTAAMALGRVGKLASSAVKPLEEILRYGVEEERTMAAYALGTLGDLRTYPRLRDALSDESPQVRTAAHQVLVSIGRPSLQTLLEAFENENDDVESTTATILGAIPIPSEDEIAYLINLILSGHLEAREASLKAFTRIQVEKVHAAREPSIGPNRENTPRTSSR